MYITACHAEIITQYAGIQIVWPRPGLQEDCEAVEETDKIGGEEGGNADTATVTLTVAVIETGTNTDTCTLTMTHRRKTHSYSHR